MRRYLTDWWRHRAWMRANLYTAHEMETVRELLESIGAKRLRTLVRLVIAEARRK